MVSTAYQIGRGLRRLLRRSIPGLTLAGRLSLAHGVAGATEHKPAALSRAGCRGPAFLPGIPGRGARRRQTGPARTATR